MWKPGYHLQNACWGWFAHIHRCFGSFVWPVELCDDLGLGISWHPWFEYFNFRHPKDMTVRTSNSALATLEDRPCYGQLLLSRSDSKNLQAMLWSVVFLPILAVTSLGWEAFGGEKWQTCRTKHDRTYEAFPLHRRRLRAVEAMWCNSPLVMPLSWVGPGVANKMPGG